MSAEHRKPVVAFVALALIAAALVGMQRAEARGGDILAAVIGAGVHVEGTLPEPGETFEASMAAPFGSALQVLVGRDTAAGSAPGSVLGSAPRSVSASGVTAAASHVGKPGSAAARTRAVRGKAAQRQVVKTRPSANSKRPSQTPARSRATVAASRAATVAPAAVTTRRSSTTGRAPHVRVGHAKRSAEHPRRAAAPAKRWRGHQHRATPRSQRAGARHHVPRR